MKKIFLFMGYLAGFVVGSKFSKKIQKQTKGKGKSRPKTLSEEAVETGKDFLESHKKAFEKLKKEYWTEENKKLVLSKKKDMEKFFRLVQAELEEAKDVLKKHGVDADAIAEKIESIYTEKKGFIEKLGADPKVKSAKKKLSTLVTKIKKSI